MSLLPFCTWTPHVILLLPHSMAGHGSHRGDALLLTRGGEGSSATPTAAHYTAWAHATVLAAACTAAWAVPTRCTRSHPKRCPEGLRGPRGIYNFTINNFSFEIIWIVKKIQNCVVKRIASFIHLHMLCSSVGSIRRNCVEVSKLNVPNAERIQITSYNHHCIFQFVKNS